MEKVKLVVMVDSKLIKKWDMKLDKDGRNRSQDIRRYISDSVIANSMEAEMTPTYFERSAARGQRKTARTASR